MKPVLIIFLLTSALLSCSSPAADKAPETNPVPEKTASLSEQELIGRYAHFVENIDSSKAENISLAADKFREMFDQSTPEICDKAYADFERFYRKVETALEGQMVNDSKLSEVPCYQDDEEGKELPANKNLQRFLTKIEKHGFRLQCVEGYPGLTMDRSFVEKNFYSFVSPTMKSYLMQLKRENEEPFSYDAGIVISAAEFIDRTVFWEKFTAENPRFIFLKEARAKYRNYLTFLLIGMDNTPLFENGENSSYFVYESVEGFSSYFDDAYTYLNKKYPKSQTNKLIAPFFKAAENNDVNSVNKILAAYLKEGKILDFKLEFGSEE